MIQSFCHIVCGYAILAVLPFHGLYHTIALNPLCLMVEGGINLNFNMFYIVLVWCLNYNILVQGYSIQDLALYCSGSYIPVL